MRKTFWQNIEEARRKGITSEEFEKIESLESAIAYHQNEIEKHEKEIKHIERTANSRLERTGV
jgi:flagellar biosynthesis chaperone FliJ